MTQDLIAEIEDMELLALTEGVEPASNLYLPFLLARPNGDLYIRPNTTSNYVITKLFANALTELLVAELEPMELVAEV